jgi:hypothetical protein
MFRQGWRCTPEYIATGNRHRFPSWTRRVGVSWPIKVRYSPLQGPENSPPCLISPGTGASPSRPVRGRRQPMGPRKATSGSPTTGRSTTTSIAERTRRKGIFRTASDTGHPSRLRVGRCLSRFNGMWAFGLLDLGRSASSVVTDEVKPFYYHCDDKRFLFGWRSSSSSLTPRYQEPHTESHTISWSRSPGPLRLTRSSGRSANCGAGVS